MSKVNGFNNPFGGLLDFMRPSVARARTPVTTVPSQAEAAQVIKMPTRQGVARAAAEARPPMEIVAKVEKYVGQLFPHLRGAMQQDMVKAISLQISDDPHARKLIA